MGKRLVGAAAALGLAVGMIVTAVVAASGVAEHTGPEPLPILATVDSVATAESGASSDSARSMAAGGVEYRFGGGLPALDDEASAWRLDAPGDVEARIAELAEHLGLAGDVTSGDGIWRVSDGGRQLEVYDQPGLPWNSYDQDASASSAVGCAVRDTEEVCEEPERPADLPSEDEAEAIARELLGDSIDGASVRVDDGITSWFVAFDPVIGGLPTVGMTSGVAVGGGGEILNASGWLGSPSQGDEYPLIGTEEALRRLQEQQMVTLVAPAPECDPGPAVDCGPVEPMEPTVVELTGVRLGLQLLGEFLVPSYLFEVEGGGPGGEIPVIAVVDELLVGPDVPPEDGSEECLRAVEEGLPIDECRADPAGVDPVAPGPTPSSPSCSTAAGFPGDSFFMEVCVDGPFRVGEAATVTVRATDENAPIREDCGSPIVTWGDEGDGDTAVCEIGCVPGGEGPGALDATFEHTYDEPGTYTVTVEVQSNCGEPPGARSSVPVSVRVEG